MAVAGRSILDHTRKRLWVHAGERCAFPDCEQALVEETRDRAEETVVGVECHIIAQRDSPNVARALSSLSSGERRRYKSLIEKRHSFDNLVLMCATHSRVIDDPAQHYSVEEVLAMKRGHRETIKREREEAQLRRRGAAAEEAPTAQAGPPRLLVLDDIPFWQRKAVGQLAVTNPSALEWLRDRLGDLKEPTPESIVRLVPDWPPPLAEGSRDLITALARTAESCALWAEASEVWERLAARHVGAARADHLVRAAIDADVGGDSQRRLRLLSQAEQADPDSPRLRLERMDDALGPEEQLELLEGLQTDDPSLRSLIAVQRSRAAMLLPDLEQAERHLTEARELERDSLQVQSMSVNLRVQRARVALFERRAFSLHEARAAMRDALALRVTMIEMGRWEESGRLLMLAGDVPALLRDLEGAQRILETALPEELEATDGAAVLGDAALRVGAGDLALQFTEKAESDDAVRRIRATVHVDKPGHREGALEELRDLALGGGPTAHHAAFARLEACLQPVRAGWDEKVAEVLRDGGHERTETGFRLLALAQSAEYERAEELAAELPPKAWAANLRLHVARERGNHTLVERAAIEVLEFGPDASGRLLAGLSLASAGRLERGREVLSGVAHVPAPVHRTLLW